jgi:hypothetical protein
MAQMSKNSLMMHHASIVLVQRHSADGSVPKRVLRDSMAQLHRELSRTLIDGGRYAEAVHALKDLGTFSLCGWKGLFFAAKHRIRLALKRTLGIDVRRQS